MLRSLCEVTAGFTVMLALVQGLSELILHLGMQMVMGPERSEIATSLELPEGPLQPESKVPNEDLASEIASSRTRLAQALDRLSSPDVDHERSMIRLALVRLGIEHPETIARIVPWVIADFADVMSDRWSALRPQLSRIRETLASIAESDPDGLAQQLIGQITDQPDHAGPVLCDGLTTLVARGHRERALMSAILTLLLAEGTTLKASTLSGIETYRDDFEFDSSSEEVST
jgi:hypothetical protein